MLVDLPSLSKKGESPRVARKDAPVMTQILFSSIVRNLLLPFGSDQIDR